LTGEKPMSEHNIIDSPAAWLSQDLYNNTSRWQYRLTDADKREIDQALQHLKTCEVDSYVFNQSCFPLPNLQKKLKEISEFVENDYGMFLLRGIPVEKYSDADLRLIYAGLGAYWGQPIIQSKAGELIGDVGDVGKKLTDKTGRGTTTKDPLPFHTDRSDAWCPSISARMGKRAIPLKTKYDLLSQRPLQVSFDSMCRPHFLYARF
jgi:hypothetical protein